MEIVKGVFHFLYSLFSATQYLNKKSELPSTIFLCLCSVFCQYEEGVSSQVKWAKFRQKVYQVWGEVSPQSIPAEKLVSNGLVVLEPVAGAGHVNNLTAVDEAVEDSGGNGSVAKEVGPLVKTLVGSNDQ